MLFEERFNSEPSEAKFQGLSGGIEMVWYYGTPLLPLFYSILKLLPENSGLSNNNRYMRSGPRSEQPAGDSNSDDSVFVLL